MMKKLIVVAALMLVFTSSAFFQTENKRLQVVPQAKNIGVPISWEYYRNSARKVSVSLPKLPVVTEEMSICSQLNIINYTVYADDAVYGVKMISKLNEKIPFFCSPAREFSEKSLLFRINEIKNANPAVKSEIVKLGELEAHFIKTDPMNYWLINDFERNQWIELWTVNIHESTEVVKDFVKSIRIGDKVAGKEIGEGSPITLGDLNDANNLQEKAGSNGEGATSSVRFLIKPASKYTNEARKKNLQGSVLLRVTFLSNGGIGGISVAQELKYGLTEEAIAAAKKIIFLPARRNGIKYSVTKTVQYNFSIY